MPILPSATSTLTGMALWSQPMFDSMWPYALFAGGVLLAVGLIWFVIGLASHGADKMKGH